MFTGIIETKGRIKNIIATQSNVDFWIESALCSELKIDQSVAHNGVCLTVVEKDVAADAYRVTAVHETLLKTNLADWNTGNSINLERALRIGDRLDGHFVQGHVDTTAQCVRRQEVDGSYLFTFSFPGQFASLVIEKGSVCINGVSLTVFNVGRTEFTVTIIPYTYEHTNFNELQVPDKVNIEFDVLGKYFLRNEALKGML